MFQLQSLKITPNRIII